MYPTLISFGRFQIHSYGLMLALSFLIGIYWSIYRVKKRNLERNHVMDVSIIVVICAIVGSRLLYVVTHVDEFRGHWTDTFNPIQSSGEIGIGGTSMLGGVVLALLAIFLYCRRKKIPVLRLFDVFAPSFALGIFLTRIGCFLAGCCYGKTCDLPWAVVFPLRSPAGVTFPSQPIHPTQLYSSLYGLIILCALLLFDRKPRVDGLLSSLFFILYGIFRFAVDFVRYYEASVTFRFIGLTLTFNQLISFFMFLIGLILFIKLKKDRSLGLKKS
ncbi:prolipoprotein diacylglyceryl transferase [bacterium]|nr:prolipoprotein diacylglyceryl transferase [bacterium]